MDFLSWWQTLPSKMDPVLISIGPLTIYWYSTMYLVAFGVVYILCSKKIKQNKFNKINLEQFEDLLSWCFIGLLIGARFGYVIFYNFFVTYNMAVFNNSIHHDKIFLIVFSTCSILISNESILSCGLVLDLITIFCHGP